MKYLTRLFLLFPAFAVAHESHSGSLGHAVEHQMLNPLWALAMFIAVAIGVYFARVYFKKVNARRR